LCRVSGSRLPFGNLETRITRPRPRSHRQACAQTMSATRPRDPVRRGTKASKLLLLTLPPTPIGVDLTYSPCRRECPLFAHSCHCRAHHRKTRIGPFATILTTRSSFLFQNGRQLIEPHVPVDFSLMRRFSLRVPETESHKSPSQRLRPARTIHATLMRPLAPRQQCQARPLECHVRGTQCQLHAYRMLFSSSHREAAGAPGSGPYRGRGRGAKRDRLAENGASPGISQTTSNAAGRYIHAITADASSFVATDLRCASQSA
jgi:hypothetical protein